MAFLISDIDPMQPFYAFLTHFIRDGMFPIAREPIHTGAHHEVGLRRLCGAEQFVDITLAVADVNTAPRALEKRCGLFQVLQPADTLLLFYWHPGRIDFLLERIAAFELFPGPKLHGCQSQRKSPHGHRQTGMHQDATDHVVLRALVETIPEGSSLYDADRLDILAVIVEFCRVVKDQNSGIGGRESIPRGLKMPCQNVPFADARVGEKTVRCFCVCPVLANQRNALPGALGELFEKFSKALVESDVSEFAAGEFAIDPSLGLASSGVINLLGALQLLPFHHGGSSPHTHTVPGAPVQTKVPNQQQHGLELLSMLHLWVIERANAASFCCPFIPRCKLTVEKFARLLMGKKMTDNVERFPTAFSNCL